ncbi:caspase domain-containing protein [Mycena rosella]|uniref:Caspase domain-containing protein n=1 Tax=Mycena rosella TaxID=1033263 RepID=A0AAD7GA24_MYCRO|nr:caspase domain-containing protein [Mycena rosella]
MRLPTSVLIDDRIDGHVQPTRTSILQAIADLVKDVKDGDYLFFHYSGHSTQVDSPRFNSEEDGKDKCIVPLDGEDMKIVDNDLHAALVVPLPPGAHLVAVLDTCHYSTSPITAATASSCRGSSVGSAPVRISGIMSFAAVRARSRWPA